MFENPGRILKVSAKIMFILGALVSFIMFVVYACKQNSNCFLYLLGIPGSFMCMLILCCIGDHTIAISKIAKIDVNYHNEVNKSYIKSEININKDVIEDDYKILADIPKICPICGYQVWEEDKNICQNCAHHLDK